MATHIYVHELAADLEMSSAEVLEHLKKIGEFATSSASKIALPAARRLAASVNKADALKIDSDTGQTGAESPNELEGLTAAESAQSERTVTITEIVDTDPTAPSGRRIGWRADPVTRPNHPDVTRELNRAEQRYSVLRDHRTALDKLGSQIVYAKMATEPVISGCTVTLVRFSGAIESAFGLTREVMILYTPYPDLQRRTFESAFKQIRSLDREVTPDVAFIHSSDPRAAVKLDDWSSPGEMAIPFNFDDTDPVGLIKLLRAHLHTRDLFNETTPVSGPKFFGRKTLLNTLRGEILSKNATGIFGLRKAGKTSVLMQLKEDLAKDKVVCVLLDLEAFPSPPHDPIDDILFELRKRILTETRSLGLSPSKFARMPESPTILQFKDSLQSLSAKLQESGHKLVLMLDEIEYLTPADQVDIAEANFPRISQFLGALRSVSQETSNFTFMLSGLTSAILENGRLYGRPNPLFSWSKPYYLGPFSKSDADTLATSVGARMGLAIDPGALDALHEASGGHAYLYRNLASSVVSSIDSDVEVRRISKAAVLKQFADWSTSVRGNIHEMINHVKRYYPEESVLLELIQDEPSEIESLMAMEPDSARHLLKLGLISGNVGDYQTNVLLDLM